MLKKEEAEMKKSLVALAAVLAAGGAAAQSSVTLFGVVDASVSNFKDGRIGDAKTLSPQLSVSAMLGSRLQASGSFGVSFTRTQLAVGHDTSTAMTGNASLCYKGSLSNFCLNGLRQVLPSAIGGVRKQTSIGTTYSLRLSERETVQLGGNYSTASAPLAGTGGDFESIRGYARYERLLNERTRSSRAHIIHH